MVRYGFQMRFAKRNNRNLDGGVLVSQRVRYAVDVLVGMLLDGRDVQL